MPVQIPVGPRPVRRLVVSAGQRGPPGRVLVTPVRTPVGALLLLAARGVEEREGIPYGEIRRDQPVPEDNAEGHKGHDDPHGTPYEPHPCVLLGPRCGLARPLALLRL